MNESYKLTKFKSRLKCSSSMVNFLIILISAWRKGIGNVNGSLEALISQVHIASYA